MSEPHTVCEELCSRSICSYKGSADPDCFAKLPEVRCRFCRDQKLLSLVFLHTRDSTPHAVQTLHKQLRPPVDRWKEPSFLEVQVQKHFHKLLAASPAKLQPGESSTPFSKDFVWVKTDILGSGAFGTVHRSVLSCSPSTIATLAVLF
jgi:hypothetical protein